MRILKLQAISKSSTFILKELMKIYSDRRAVAYLSNLKNKLSLWDEAGEPIEGGLIDTAIPLSTPKKI
ncbi:MAG: hypothetical protein AAFY48_19075, partial [Bacteroidota bacterium]